MTSADGRAERLAPWIRTMPLQEQVLITGTTLVLEEIRNRRDDLPFPIDEAAIREAPTPGESISAAESLADSYAAASPHIGPDGVDEHWRVSNMARVVADTIRARFA